MAADNPSSFESITNAYLAYLYEAEPVMATQMGVHDFDDRLPDRTRHALDERLRKSRAYLHEIDNLSVADLSMEQRLDYRIARANTQWSVVQLEQSNPWFREPGRYIEEALSGLFYLMLDSGSDLTMRAESLASRLKTIPRLLSQAHDNLSSAPIEFTEAGLEAVAGAAPFLQEAVSGFAAQVEEAGLRREIETAQEKALIAVHGFGEHVRTASDSSSDFAIGSDLFNYALRVYHMMDDTPDDLEEIGRQSIEQAKSDLRRLAAQVHPTKDWESIAAELKKDHPAADELVSTYHNEMRRAREFVRVNGLVTLPEDETLAVIETPTFQRSLYPYAAYMPAGPFEERQHAHFWVTPIDGSKPADVQESQLQGHSQHGIAVIALHEAYPGHHLQFTIANRVESRYRRHFADSNLFIEGWALYCEEMMYETGFYTDPRARLLQAKAQLWRACRVVIDVGLHTRKMSPQQAVQFLVNEARLEEVAARAEVRRYCLSPTQPMTYVMGRRAIMDIRRQAERRLGSRFNLRQFHDDLLSHGPIQPRLLREALEV